jgi:hypothetical protein
MKYLLCLLLSFTVFSSFSQELAFDKLEIGFQKGDEKIILTHVVDKLLLNIEQKESVYSKSQAEMILRDFFTKNPPKSFKFIFKGTKGGSTCAVGILVCANKEYRVSIALKEETPIFKLEQLNIEAK